MQECMYNLIQYLIVFSQHYIIGLSQHYIIGLFFIKTGNFCL